MVMLRISPNARKKAETNSVPRSEVMGWNTVFGEDVDKEKPSKLGRGNMSIAGE
jgi:hypothetical protein